MPQIAQTRAPAPPIASRSPEEPAFRDDWYLLPYQSPGQNRLGLRRLLGRMPKSGARDWPKILTAFALSAFVGLGAAAFRTTEQANHSSSVSTATIRYAQTVQMVPATTPAPARVKPDANHQLVSPHPLSSDEANRLKTRNRRLEALVKVLRQRAERKNPAHE